MIITLVVAASENNAIGKNNQLLWHLPNDLKFFKNTTWAMPVVMGRKTYVSLGNNPLNGRFNIIITRQQDFTAPGITVVNSLEAAIALAQSHDYKELMVLGGGEIYAAAMHVATKMVITRVHAIFDDADTFFPSVDENLWSLSSHQDFEKDEKHAYAYSFQVWERK